MKVVWTTPATSDLEQILAFLAERNPAAAAKVAVRIKSTVRSIGEYPMAGRLDADVGCRERIVARTPLIVIYTIDEPQQLVEIIAVFHTSRDPESKRAP